MIKAIETVYKGYRFRSRLEARWAVFFDALDIKWEYEVEGYQSGKSRYLPDFHFPSLKCYVEIKGSDPTEIEIQKIKRFASQSNKPVYVFVGSQFAPFDHSRPPTIIPNPDHEDIVVGENAFYHMDGRELTPTELDAWNKTPRLRVIDDGSRGSWAIQYYQTYSSGPYVFAQCPKCLYVSIEHGFYDDLCPVCNDCLLDENTSHLIAAYIAARQARFEHGEKP